MKNWFHFWTQSLSISSLIHPLLLGPFPVSDRFLICLTEIVQFVQTWWVEFIKTVIDHIWRGLRWCGASDRCKNGSGDGGGFGGERNFGSDGGFSGNRGWRRGGIGAKVWTGVIPNLIREIGSLERREIQNLLYRCHFVRCGRFYFFGD